MGYGQSRGFRMRLQMAMKHVAGGTPAMLLDARRAIDDDPPKGRELSREDGATTRWVVVRGEQNNKIPRAAPQHPKLSQPTCTPTGASFVAGVPSCPTPPRLWPSLRKV